MKRFVALLLLFSLVCSLAACGDPAQQGNMQTTVETDPEATTDTVSVPETTVAATSVPETTAATVPVTEAATEPDNVSVIMSVAEFQLFIQEYLDLSDYELSYEYENQCSYERKGGGLGTPTRDIVVCGTKIDLGQMKVAALTAMGWTLVDNVSKDKQVEAHQYISSYTFQKNGMRMDIAIYNPSAQAVNFWDARVDTLYLYFYDVYEGTPKGGAPEFSAGGKINQDSTLYDILNAFGDPESVGFHCGTLYGGTSFSYITLEYGDMEIKLYGNGKILAYFYLRAA